MKRLVLVVALLPVCAPSDHAGSAEGPHWSYAGPSGPEHWGALDSAFTACSAGRAQSPINLATFVEADLPPLVFSHTAGAVEVQHHGHTIQVPVPPGNALRVGERAYALRQFHFHAPSENQIEGRAYPLEAHFVHADSSGALLVVAVMFQEGAASAALDEIWAHTPEVSGATRALPAPLAPAALLPPSRDYYRFGGSLTTPPCSEDVEWHVLREPASASAEQVAFFSAKIGHANNRPLQPVNDRPVYR